MYLASLDKTFLIHSLLILMVGFNLMDIRQFCLSNKPTDTRL